MRIEDFNIPDHVYVGVSAILLRDSFVLLGKRTDIVNLHGENMWEIPGGGVLLEESTEDAIRRELDEELNCSPACLTKANDIYHFGRNTDPETKEKYAQGAWWKTTVFIGSLDLSERPLANPALMEPVEDEPFEEWAWFKKEHIAILAEDLVLRDSTRIALEIINYDRRLCHYKLHKTKTELTSSGYPTEMYK